MTTQRKKLQLAKLTRENVPSLPGFPFERGPWKTVEFFHLDASQDEVPGWYWHSIYRDVEAEQVSGPFGTEAEAEADARNFRSKLG